MILSETYVGFAAPIRKECAYLWPMIVSTAKDEQNLE